MKSMRCPESRDDMYEDDQGRWWCDFCMDAYELVGHDNEKRYRQAGFHTEAVDVSVPRLKRLDSAFDLTKEKKFEEVQPKTSVQAMGPQSGFQSSSRKGHHENRFSSNTGKFQQTHNEATLR